MSREDAYKILDDMLKFGNTRKEIINMAKEIIDDLFKLMGEKK